MLTGGAQLACGTGAIPVDPCGPVFPLAALHAGEHTTLEWVVQPDGPPIRPQSTFTVGFGFGGSVSVPQGPPIFPAFAFSAEALLPPGPPATPPIVPIGTFTSSVLSLGPIAADIVAFDDPVAIGRFSITVRPAPVPAPPALLLVGTGILSLGGAAFWRRSRRRQPK